MNKITAAAAIFYQDQLYSVPPPGRHHNVMALISEKTGVKSITGEKQDFLDATGKFLDRVSALRLAIRHNLLPSRIIDDSGKLLPIKGICWKETGKAGWDDLYHGERVKAILKDGREVFGRYFPRNKVIGGVLTSEDLW